MLASCFFSGLGVSSTRSGGDLGWLGSRFLPFSLGGEARFSCRQCAPVRCGVLLRGRRGSGGHAGPDDDAEVAAALSLWTFCSPAPLLPGCGLLRRRRGKRGDVFWSWSAWAGFCAGGGGVSTLPVLVLAAWKLGERLRWLFPSSTRKRSWAWRFSGCYPGHVPQRQWRRRLRRRPMEDCKAAASAIVLLQAKVWSPAFASASAVASGEFGRTGISRDRNVNFVLWGLSVSSSWDRWASGAFACVCVALYSCFDL